MKKIIAASIICALASSPAFAQIHIENGRIFEKTGKEFIMRGINHAHLWYPQTTRKALKDIAKTKANTVRIVLSNGKIWNKSSVTEIKKLIQEAKRLNLIIILEVHDTTGHEPSKKDENYKSSTIIEAAEYWAEVKNAIIGQEDYVIINIGNEPSGNGDGANEYWFNQNKEAISIIRNAGIKNAIMIDGANWGQEHSLTMAKSAPEIFASDPLKNIIFSVHMYQEFGKDETIKSYIDTFEANKLPLIIGEFGPDHQGEPVDEETIFSYSKEKGIGWLGWSWSGNSKLVENLDMVEKYNPKKLSPWGVQIINGPNGLKASSKPASIYTSRPIHKKIWNRIMRLKYIGNKD